jgi:DNA repair exonuclease SbcCD ATPase subunit
LAAKLPPADPPEVTRLRNELASLSGILPDDHVEIRTRKEKLAELCPPEVNMAPSDSGAPPSVLLQRKLRYLSILEKRLQKQDKRVQAAEDAFNAAQKTLNEARERGRQLLAQQDKARKERAELASQVDPPVVPVAPPPWLAKAEELATAAPEGPLTGLLAQFKQLSEQIHALAVAPPPPAPHVSAVSLAPDAPGQGEEEQAKDKEKDRGRSRTPPGKNAKKQRQGAKDEHKAADPPQNSAESDAEEEKDNADGVKTPEYFLCLPRSGPPSASPHPDASIPSGCVYDLCPLPLARAAP